MMPARLSQKNPERDERRGRKRIVLAPLHHSGEHLGDAAVEDAHAEDHGIEGEEPRVVEVQQHGGEAERAQPERRGVRGRVLQGYRRDFDQPDQLIITPHRWLTALDVHRHSSEGASTLGGDSKAHGRNRCICQVPSECMRYS